jgi:hypothetical protein
MTWSIPSAAQAFAAVTDPISQLPDVPAADLRAELLRGAIAILATEPAPR